MFKQDLFEQLKEQFGMKLFEPVGAVIPIYCEKFNPAWRAQLESLGCTVFTQTFADQKFFFVHHPKGQITRANVLKKGVWTKEEENMLLELKPTLAVHELSSKLGRSKGSIQHKIAALEQRGK
jgi:hypothetical protein